MHPGLPTIFVPMNTKHLLSLFLFTCASARAQNNQFIQVSSLDSISNDAMLAPFDKQLENKRVVFLGDIVHGEANLDSARAYIIDYLINKHGFNTIAFESGIYNLHVANNHFKAGMNVNEVLSGSIFSVWSGQSLQPLIQIIEKHRYKINLIGFDLQYSGNNTYDLEENLMGYLNSIHINPDSQLIEEWQDICINILDFNVQDLDTIFFKKTLSGLKKHFERANASHKSTREYKTWMQILRSSEKVYRWLKIEGIADKSNKDFRANNSNSRDQMMAANLKFYLDLFPDMKAICWGASAHFARNTSALSNEELHTFKPMGSYFGDEAMVIGAIGYTGKFGWSGNVQDMPALPENSIERKLSQMTDNTVLVDLQHWKDKMPLYSSVFVESSLVFGDWSQVFDWVVFMKEVIPKILSGKTGSVNSNIDSTKHIEKLDRDFEKQTLVLKGKGIPLKGKTIDKNGVPIPFSSIALKGTSIGAVANENGEFLIKIPTIEDATLVFSNVGYQVKELAASELKKDLAVVLDDKQVMLPEIIVSDGKNHAIDILIEAIERIEENYGHDPISHSILHRSLYTDSLSGEVTSVDWVVKSFFEYGYKENPPQPSLQILNARTGMVKNGNHVEYRPYKTSFWDFIGLGLLDQVMYRKRSYLNRRNHKFFTFELENIFDDDNEMYFKIAFVCNKISSKTATYSMRNPIRYQGSILINASDYAIVETESVLIMYVKKIPKSVKRRGDFKMGISFLKVSASYAKQGKYYALIRSSQFSDFDKNGYRKYYYFDKSRDSGSAQLPESNGDFEAKEYDKSYWQSILERVE